MLLHIVRFMIAQRIINRGDLHQLRQKAAKRVNFGRAAGSAEQITGQRDEVGRLVKNQAIECAVVLSKAAAM